MQAVIGIGSNLGDKRRNISQAITRVEVSIGEVLKKSQFYETAPLLHPEFPVYGQENFINAAILVETKLDPEEVLRRLLEIEDQLGRTRPGVENGRTAGWGPRTIDLDIICAEDLIFNTKWLVIPHPEMHKRVFVLEPLIDVCPGWYHPLLQKTASQLLHNLSPGSKNLSTFYF